MRTAPSRTTAFLAGLSTVGLVAAAAFLAFVVVGAAAGFGPGGDDVAVRTAVPAAAVAGLPAGATPAGDDVALTARVRDASDAQIRWQAARDLAPLLLVVLVLSLLRGILVSVRRGDPFTTANVGRLRALAAALVVGVPVATFVSSLFAGELADSAGVAGPGTQLAVSGNVLLGGLALLVLAEVFAHGVRLRDDLEGTV